MSVTLGWEARLAEDARGPSRTLSAAPLDPIVASRSVRVVSSAADAWDLLNSLRSTAIAAIALETTRTTRAGDDPRFVAPTALALSAWLADGAMVSAVVSLSAYGALEPVGALLGMPLTWVAHDIKPLLFGLWRLGLNPQFHSLHDTWVAGAALALGANHARSVGPTDDYPDAIHRRQEAEAQRNHDLSLEGQCARHRRPLPIPPEASGSIPDVDVRVVAARTAWALDLYLWQQPEIVAKGLHAHLHGIEFPYAVVNARMEYRGVHVDRRRYQALREGCTRAARAHARTLAEHGVAPPGSPEAFQRAVARLGLASKVTSMEDRTLRPLQGLHPIVGAFLRYRWYSHLARDPWSFDAQGRVHPDHRQLGAATGRNACRRPNLAGLPRILRPVVTAPPGRALIEFDYGQIEIGVAAAEHGDEALIDAFNGGDVYASAAQRFFEGSLSQAERSMSASEFARVRPELRDAMKPFVLALLYGAGPQSIAERFGVSEHEARARMDKFLALYPTLSSGMDAASAYGMGRGHAAIVTGLRREFDREAPRRWVHNLLRNTQIQGGAAVVLKEAAIQLDRTLSGTSAWVVLTIYDSVLIECDAGDVEWIKQRVPQVMVDAVRRFYARLAPRVDVNDADVSCWSKRGHSDSLERFLADPNYSLDSETTGGVDRRRGGRRSVRAISDREVRRDAGASVRRRRRGDSR